MTKETNLNGISIHKINKFGKRFFQANTPEDAKRDLKEIRSKIEAMSHSGLFKYCPCVLEKITGAIAGKLADIEFERIKTLDRA